MLTSDSHDGQTKRDTPNNNISRIHQFLCLMRYEQSRQRSIDGSHRHDYCSGRLACLTMAELGMAR
jgi:hypothetical protein